MSFAGFDPRNALLPFGQVGDALSDYGKGMVAADENRKNDLIGQAYSTGGYDQAARVAGQQGNLNAMIALSKGGREEEGFNLEKRAKVAQLFGNAAQDITRRFEADPNDPTAHSDAQRLFEHPEFKGAFLKSPYGYSWSTPQEAARSARMLALEAVGPQDPLARKRLELEIKSLEGNVNATEWLRGELGGPGQGITARNAKGLSSPTQGAGVPSGVPGISISQGAPPPAQAPIAPPGTAPIQSLAEKYRRAQMMIASGVPAFVTAGETQMKQITEDLKNGYQLTADGGVAGIPNAAEEHARREGLKKQAEAEQGNYEKASNASWDAKKLGQTAKDLRTLAPYAITGSLASWDLELRRLGNKVQELTGVPLGQRVDATKLNPVAATELLRSGMTQFITSEAQKLKPVSGSDITFIQNSVGSVGSDPSALPHILGAWERAAERTELFHDLEAQSYTQDMPQFNSRRGFPNRPAIMKYVEQKLPSYVEAVMGQRAGPGQQANASPGNAQPAAAAPRGAATAKAQIGSLPEGSITPNGTHIRVGGGVMPLSDLSPQELAKYIPLGKIVDVGGARKIMRKNGLQDDLTWEEKLQDVHDALGDFIGAFRPRWPNGGSAPSQPLQHNTQSPPVQPLASPPVGVTPPPPPAPQQQGQFPPMNIHAVNSLGSQLNMNQSNQVVRRGIIQRFNTQFGPEQTSRALQSLGIQQ